MTTEQPNTTPAAATKSQLRAAMQTPLGHFAMLEAARRENNVPAAVDATAALLGQGVYVSYLPAEAKSQ